ncbi:MOSC domain-containing protein [Desulfurispira natronophila]|uniref:MOSC domain-containing protein YiiM n=1 Tax=Desulfurispira natronophila TaxID=682562 RepID=A0A7W7Y2G3_9BACT|nr:MOSC domain-containing protein [Desulfurispira natronophila]MBB5020860.1 MOSC domain-containing protein YiiM [Desulfurispira natronophila]
MNPKATVKAVCTSASKGERKKDVQQASFVTDHGIQGDGHAGPGHRQVSLLAMESIEKMRKAGLKVGPGDFAENLTTEGIILHTLPVGTVLQIGDVVMEVSQIGKLCHERCAIYYQAGDCVMPKEGIFTVVKSNGIIKSGDTIQVKKA